MTAGTRPTTARSTTFGCLSRPCDSTEAPTPMVAVHQSASGHQPTSSANDSSDAHNVTSQPAVRATGSGHNGKEELRPAADRPLDLEQLHVKHNGGIPARLQH